MAEKFAYLLNAMEGAAQEEHPSLHGYAAKRRAVLEYVEQLEKDRNIAAEFIAEMRERLDRIMPMLRLALRVSATDSATSAEKAHEVGAVTPMPRAGLEPARPEGRGILSRGNAPERGEAAQQLSDGSEGEADEPPSQVGTRSATSGRGSATNPATSAAARRGAR